MKLFGAHRRGETAKPLQFLVLMKAMYDCGGNRMQRSAGVRHHEGNSVDPRKDVSWNWWCSLHIFQERLKTALFVSYNLLREEAIILARSLNIPRSRFKASKWWAIRFMCQMGLALRRRTMRLQKLPKDFKQKFLNYQQHITNLRKKGNFLLGQIAMLCYSTLFDNCCC
jgi:hypothetical protein